MVFKKHFIKTGIHLFFLLVLSRVVMAQSPVLVTAAIMPPYSTLLSEYYSGDGQRVSISLLNTDPGQPFLQGYLRVTIEGNGVKLQSNTYGNYPILDLMHGSPVMLNGTDLAAYFRPENLSGSVGQGFQQQNRLPEGFYSFCFEVLEKNTNRIIGNKQCAQVYLQLNDPPFLLLPEKGKPITYANPFNLLFQWSPRHLNVTNTEYQFDLVEIWDTTITPEAAFYTAKPVYSTTVYAPNLFYGPGEPQLLVGKKYAWRIKATVKTSTNEQEPFKNDGYSEVFWFKLQGECTGLQKATIVSDPLTNRTTLSWTPDVTTVGPTTLEYRQKGSTNWVTKEAAQHTVSLTGLAWNTDYEYKLGNRCVITDDYAYGSLQTFKTLTQDTANCVPSTIEPLSNQEPIAQLRAGDTIYASGFRMRLTQVAGANGVFSGQGFLALMIPTTTTEVSVKAAFTNITVNTDKQVVAGNIVSLYDKTEKGIGNIDPLFHGGIGTGDVKTGGTSVDTTVNVPIDPSVNAGVEITGTVPDTTYTVTLTSVDGKPVVLTTKKLPVIVQDSKGDIYSIDKNGKVTPVGKASGALLAGKTPDMLDKLASDKGKVTFEAHEEQVYAFDPWQDDYGKSSLFSQYYQSLNNGVYRVGNKLLVTNSTDKIIAKVSGLESGWNADSIKFITGTGIEFTAQKKGNKTYEITLLSGPANDAQELYAIYRDNEGFKANTNASLTSKDFTYSLGKLKIATYAPKQLSVTLVPVGNTQVNSTAISERLNKIYNPVGVSWTVNKTDAFTLTNWDNDNDGKLNITGAGKYNQYSDEMKALNLSYLQNATVDEHTPYLFVFSNSPKAGTDEQGKGVMGDMLRNKQFGYLFLSNNNDPGQVTAHELGHGVFHLNHTFDDQYKLQLNNLPTNLMNYSGGDQLVKLQWDAIYAPGIVIGLFEKEGDAEYNDNSTKLIFVNTYQNCPKTMQTYTSYTTAFALPYEKNWKPTPSIPTYWIKIDDVPIHDEFDDNGNLKTRPYLIKISSPRSLSGFTPTTEHVYNDGEIFDKYFKQGPIATVVEQYQMAIETYRKINWASTSDPITQSATNIDKLAKAIIKGGELDPYKVCTLDPSVLYGIQYNNKNGKTEMVYYNAEELSYWLWGYFAYSKLNFNYTQLSAFGMQYFGRDKYIPYHDTYIYDVPWKAKAMKEGCMNAADSYDEIYMNFRMDQTYSVFGDDLVDGTGIADLVEVTLFIYTGGTAGIGKTLTIQMGKKMTAAAVTNWLVQVAVEMISTGETYDVAITKVNYKDVLYTGLSTAVVLEKEAMALDCIKEMIFKYNELINQKKQVNIPVILTRECIFSLIKNALFNKYLTGSESIYAESLRRAFKNKTIWQIKNNIRVAFGCTTSEIEEILAVIPKEILDELIKLK